ncbi:MAG TPA: ABC transporter substrate-binding protein, partial [Chloroflexota bacterium]
LLLALDRQTLADALSDRLAPVADAFLPPDDVRWDWVKDLVVKYPYDPRQAEALFVQAGLQRGSDGVMQDSAGNRMVLPHWTTPGPDHEQQLAIEGDQWRQVGVVTQQVILSGTQANDRRTRSAFPALNNAGWPSATIASIEGRFLAANCPTERNDWNGQNYGCFMAPTWEPIISRLKAAIDPEDQREPFQELARRYTEELPLLPLYFDVSMEVFREGITGVKGNAKPDGSITWNIADWDIL